MTAAKKQKTGNNSSSPTKPSESDSSTPHKNESKNESSERDVTKFPPREYICVNRPQFDYEAGNRILGENKLNPSELHKKFQDDYETDSGLALALAKDHPDWKWVIMNDGWKMFCDYKRRASYCCPDLFGLDMYTDHEGWGLQELVENWLLDFDTAFHKKDDESSRYGMWAVISGIGLWANIADMGPFYGCEDGPTTLDLCELVGCALLTALASIDKAGELKAGSVFLDLGKVITEYLEWSVEHESYGIEDHAIYWRPHAAAYFKKAELDNSNGVASTAKLLEELESSEGETREPGKDPWDWEETLKKYKKGRGKIGGTHYDITKMSRAERADAAYDDIDPLKDIPIKDLREGNLVVA